jgi:predicted dehydrogenase
VNPIRIALVGAGSMGSNHARVIHNHEQTALAAVVDPSEDNGRPVAERFDVPWVADLDDIRDVDAVVVAAATQYHPEIGHRVLDRGLPLLMEKPLADRLADSEALVESSRAKDVPLMCGLLERFNPGILTALSIMEEPRHIRATRHSPYVARIRTGVASDLLVHDIDIVVRMMGSDPTKVLGTMGYVHPESAPGSEDVAEVLLSFGPDRIANVSASRLSHRKIREFSIVELDRLIEVDMLRNAVTIYRHVLGENTDDGLSYKQQTIIEIPQLVSNREPLAAQLDRFVALVRGQVDAEEERATILPAHRVIEQMRAEALEGV